MAKCIIFLGVLIVFIGCGDQYSQGKRIYESLCSNCHGEDGSGLKHLIPSLQNNADLSNTSLVVCTIKNGINADGSNSNLSIMPSHPKMTAVELTNLMNYMNQTFLKEPQYITIENVTESLKACKE